MVHRLVAGIRIELEWKDWRCITSTMNDSDITRQVNIFTVTLPGPVKRFQGGRDLTNQDWNGFVDSVSNFRPVISSIRDRSEHEEERGGIISSRDNSTAATYLAVESVFEQRGPVGITESPQNKQGVMQKRVD